MSEILQASVASELYAVGHVVVRGLLAVGDVETLREGVAELRAGVPRSRDILYTHRPPPTGQGAGMDGLMDQWLNPHRRVGPGSTLRHAAGLRPLVSALLGGPAVLFQDLVLDKRSHHGTFHWHQDFPFWPVDRPRGLVVWAALDPVSEASGGLRLARSTGECGPAIDLYSGFPQPGFEGATVPSLDEWVAPSLQAGDAVVFLPLTWHSSGENREGTSRRVWASTWLANDVCWRHAAAPRHPLVGRVIDGAPVGGGGWAPMVEGLPCDD